MVRLDQARRSGHARQAKRDGNAIRRPCHASKASKAFDRNQRPAIAICRRTAAAAAAGIEYESLGCAVESQTAINDFVTCTVAPPATRGRHGNL